MKKSILLALVLLFQVGFAQGKLTETQKLVATAKVWGFLKYYHPNVADGNLDWDSQLFYILPKVEKAQNKEEFSVVIENWISTLGKVNKCITCNNKIETKYLYKNLNLSWIQTESLFSKSLSNKLRFIKNNRYQGKHFYVKKEDPIAFVEITNEVKYIDFKWTDKQLRLLALFRFWNIVEYFYPYKYQMEQKWDETLEELLPKFIDPQSELDFHLVLQELVIHLNDTHTTSSSNILWSYFGKKFISAEYKIIDNKVIINKFSNDSLSKINDIKIGDIVTKVNGKTIAEIIKEKEKYINASNRSVLLRNFKFLIFSGNTDTVDIEFVRDGKTFAKTINRYSYKDLKIEFPKNGKWKLLENNIGYVNMGELSVEDVSEMMRKLNDTKAIIFDIRNYPHDTEYEIAKYLNSKPVEFVKQTSPDLSYPGRFIWDEPIKCGENNNDNYKGKVIILVNEETQSHGEWTAMCLQTADKAMIIGSQTAGADGGITRFEIIQGFTTQISGKGVFFPDGRETQRIGIVPNIVVIPTILGIQQGKDEVLQRSLNFIETGK